MFVQQIEITKALAQRQLGGKVRRLVLKTSKARRLLVVYEKMSNHVVRLGATQFVSEHGEKFNEKLVEKHTATALGRFNKSPVLIKYGISTVSSDSLSSNSNLSMFRLKLKNKQLSKDAVSPTSPDDPTHEDLVELNADGFRELMRQTIAHSGVSGHVRICPDGTIRPKIMTHVSPHLTRRNSVSSQQSDSGHSHNNMNHSRAAAEIVV